METQKAKKKGGSKDKQKKSKSNKSEQNEDKKGQYCLVELIRAISGRPVECCKLS